jgi:hypothetical protein
MMKQLHYAIKEYLKFDFKLFSMLSLTFIAMTVIGTLTHEFGHYAVAKYLGYDATINYKSSSFSDSLTSYRNEMNEKYSNEICNNLDFPGKEKYDKIWQKYRVDSFWIVVGGPLETILTGTIGFVFFIAFRKKYISKNRVHFIGWVMIFIALFWIRQVANLFMAFLYLYKNKEFQSRGDEYKLARYFDFHPLSIQISTGFIGICILAIIIRLLPKQIILTFLLAGLVGGIFGYYLWLEKFGKFIMP